MYAIICLREGGEGKFEGAPGYSPLLIRQAFPLPLFLTAGPLPSSPPPPPSHLLVGSRSTMHLTGAVLWSV